jgi:hypothetical protein
MAIVLPLPPLRPGVRSLKLIPSLLHSNAFTLSHLRHFVKRKSHAKPHSWYAELHGWKSLQPNMRRGEKEDRGCEANKEPEGSWNRPNLRLRFL